MKTGKPGRMPKPTPQWHKLTDEEREAELGKLRGYENEIIPLLGHLGKKSASAGSSTRSPDRPGGHRGAVPDPVHGRAPPAVGPPPRPTS